MFKYNELSDLITGELVTPIQKEGDKIACIDKNSDLVYYSFEDFDFDKTIDERNFIVDDGSSDDFSSSSDDGSSDDIQEIIEEETDETREHWITDNGKKEEILNASGYSPIHSIRDVNIIQFTLS